MAPEGRLQGVFPPVMVPLGERRGINEAELRRYVDWLIETEGLVAALHATGEMLKAGRPSGGSKAS